MTFGERLIYARELRGYNQKQFAEVLEVSPTRLNYWEKDKRQPDVPMLWRIISTLKISGNWLIGEDGNIEIVTKNNLLELSEKDPQLNKLIENYNKMNDFGKERLVEHSDEMLCIEKYTENKVDTSSKKEA